MHPTLKVLGKLIFLSVQRTIDEIGPINHRMVLLEQSTIQVYFIIMRSRKIQVELKMLSIAMEI